MKLDGIVMKLEEGDILCFNRRGIFMIKDYRIYLAEIAPKDIPQDGRVTFRDYGPPEDGQAMMVFTYRPEKAYSSKKKRR